MSTDAQTRLQNTCTIILFPNKRSYRHPADQSEREAIQIYRSKRKAIITYGLSFILVYNLFKKSFMPALMEGHCPSTLHLMFMGNGIIKY